MVPEFNVLAIIVPELVTAPTAKLVNVPTAVMPVYDPLIRAVATVPLAKLVAFSAVRYVPVPTRLALMLPIVPALIVPAIKVLLIVVEAILAQVSIVRLP